MTDLAQKYGFSLKQSRFLPELEATLVELIHVKTGAQLVWMDNKQDNKLFCVGFKTLPEDSTGVFHILEHSVLCGSAKYPVREPFVELLKSSMNTFLNAMTFPDKTIYPVSSRNDQDFLNLTSVYLDAVFAPRILTDPNIFYQEGWHAEILEEPCFKGVVFNEMKGAMADVDDRIEQGMLNLMLPDTCYRHNSGGDPAHIPELTYEQFVDTYRRFYHPCNARFFLDGDIPLEQTLSLIAEYLDAAGESVSIPQIRTQQPVCRESTAYYEVSEAENNPRKAILTLGKLLCTWRDREVVMAAQVLCDVLAGSNEAPLKRAILATGLAEDVRMSVSDGVAQPYFTLQIRNMADDTAEALRDVIRTTVERLCREGIRKNALEASINSFAYALRQKPEPQGLYRCINAYNSWLYGGDPVLYLQHGEHVTSLREMAQTDGFEKLLSELLLKDDLCVLHMLPSPTLGQQEQAAEQEKLDAYLKTVDPKQLQQENEALLRWQQTEDTPEQLATLPQLPLSQIGKMPPSPPTQVLEEAGVRVLYHSIPTEGIEYLNLYFTLEDYTQEQLTELSLITALLNKLPAAGLPALELQEQVKRDIGSLNFGIGVFADHRDPDHCTPCLTVSAGYLQENREKAFGLIRSILLETDLDQPDAIREIVVQRAEMAKQRAMASGHALGVSVVQSHYSAEGVLSEALSGLTKLQSLRALADDFETLIGQRILDMQQLQRTVLCRSRLTASLTATQFESLSSLLEHLPQGSAPAQRAVYRAKLPKRLGIQIPAQTAFAVKGCHLRQCGRSYDGSLSVAENVLSLSFLWNRIRVQGGAYGAGMITDLSGPVEFYSYRDPSPERSLKVYDETADFLENFREETDKYIISTVASTEPLRSPAALGRVADNRFFSGLADQDRQQIREQMLQATDEVLRGWADALRTAAREGAVCVVAHKAALEECKDLQIVAI